MIMIIMIYWWNIVLLVVVLYIIEIWSVSNGNEIELIRLSRIWYWIVLKYRVIWLSVMLFYVMFD